MPYRLFTTRETKNEITVELDRYADFETMDDLEGAGAWWAYLTSIKCPYKIGFGYMVIQEGQGKPGLEDLKNFISITYGFQEREGED